MMKKKLIVIIFLVVFCLGLTSCSSKQAKSDAAIDFTSISKNAADVITDQSPINNEELKWKWVVEAGKYDELSFVDANWIAVKGGNGKYKVINTQGESVLPNEYDQIDGFYDGVAMVGLDGKSSYIDKKGRSITDKWYQSADPFSEARGAVQQNNKWGYINQSGELIIQPRFEEVKSFIGNRAAVKLAGSWGFIDNSGHMVVKPQYDQVEEYSEGMAAVQLDDKWGFVNSDGNLITTLEYDQVKDFHEGYAAVMNNNKWGFIDTHGQVSVDLKYDDVGNFSEGKAAVKVAGYTEDGDAWAYIDYDGNIVIDFYPYNASEGLMIEVGEFKNGLAFVSKDLYCIIDSKGSNIFSGDSKFYISAFYYDNPFNVIPGYIFTDENMTVRKYGLMGLHAEQRLAPIFDFIGEMNGPYATVINVENGIEKKGIIEIYN
ncbi:WG repeat-containing protein [Paenibacillus sp. PR3]|uniref:WG repeat-containing protein n=1 Tax=Paenibacillus terricola TaxID=2763503 RepID=A0ABR8N058_9BACL|nr:WG repeat-containing protein [Paenibacillus terricola]MBD3920896.1 WG repeat-containing protein [Paenibacillus terricola]